MSDADRLAAARDALKGYLRALFGPLEIPSFEEALTHSSFANEAAVGDNQRLEFLGDSILGLCVSEILLRAHEAADEGMLTRMRSALVNSEALATWARSVPLGPAIALGRGAKLGTEREQTSVLADATEALIAAVYGAGGLEAARALVKDIVGDRIQNAQELATPDPKSGLQERVQAQGKPAPTYRVIQLQVATGEPLFEAEVLLEGSVLSRGRGRSKRLAERAAALAALDSWRPPDRG